MGDDGYKPTLGYAVSIASVALALSLTLLLHPLLQPSVFPLFFAAVTVSAWYGGLGPGLVATVLSDISMDVFLLEPPGILNIDLGEFLRLTVFTLVTGLTSSLQARRKRAEEALRREQRQLEVRVQERTAELSQTNEALRAEILNRQETERSLTESEEKLRDSEERFRMAFDYAPIGKALQTPDGKLLQVNRALCQILGYEVDELLSMTLEAIAHPDDLKADSQHRRELLVGKIASYQIGKRYTHKQGNTIWTSESVSLVFDARRHPLYYITQIRDISQRKRAEEERQQFLRQLTQRVKELTVLHHTARLLQREEKGTVASLQDVVAVLPSGWQYPEITGARILFDGSEYQTGNFKASPWRQRGDFSTVGGKQGAVEIVYLEERPSEVEGPFLAEERSLVDSLVEMLKLYLERKEASIRVAQFAQDLEERNKELLRLQGEVGRVERLAALGQITGSIAHDLGTPLNSVLGYTQILRQDKLPESTRRRLNIIETQVERMVEIINQYLSRSRDSFQKREGVNANKLIEETLDLLSPMFQQQQVEVTTNLSRSVPLIRGDVVSLQRVLINLLDNAIDAMGPGGHITITTGPTAPSERPQPGVSIMIIDTGPGIRADLLPKIFDFFVTTKAPGKGTGMGLPVCKEIVKQHGGTIHITSQEGQGTTVALVLPIDATAGRDAAVPIENRSPAR